MYRRPCSLLATLVCLLSLFGPVENALAVSDGAPEWTLETPDGVPVSFRDQLGEGPVVVSFWALWCKPCLKELPQLARLSDEYAERVTFLAVNTDESKSVAKVGPYLQGKDWDRLTVVLDTGAEVQQMLQIGIMPFLLVYDAEGREVYRHVGYKDGDEHELQQRLEELLAAPTTSATAVAGAAPTWAGVVTASDRLEYSYSGETRREIFDNWLDVSYRFGGFRTGIMLNSQAPGEEGERSNTLAHRFVEFGGARHTIRAGHFWGLFGRGLVFNSYEDRTVRVDTRLDGFIARYRGDRITAAAFSGTPSLRQVDIRGGDVEMAAGHGVLFGASGLTWRTDDVVSPEGKVNRDWVLAFRARQNFSFGDYYVEYGARNGFDLDLSGFDPAADNADEGWALYGNLNLYRGPISVSWEMSDYEDFELVSRADGVTALNRPPALARNFTWTLLNRAPHILNANDEQGRNLDVIYNGPDGLTLTLTGAHIKRHDGGTVYDLAFIGLEKERWRDLRLVGGFGYQDSEGLRQTTVGEVTWFASATRAWSLQFEHQHVRVGGGPGFDLGAYDQQWFKLEYETAPRWSFAAIFETNNKYEDQRAPDEEKGPFPSGLISRTLADGATLNLWFGKRQAGFLCSGGVCKFEPAFEGMEIFGIFRY